MKKREVNTCGSIRSLPVRHPSPPLSSRSCKPPIPKSIFTPAPAACVPGKSPAQSDWSYERGLMGPFFPALFAKLQKCKNAPATRLRAFFCLWAKAGLFYTAPQALHKADYRTAFAKATSSHLAAQPALNSKSSPDGLDVAAGVKGACPLPVFAYFLLGRK